MAEESNLIEQASNTENGFDANAFISSETAKDIESIEESSTEQEVQTEDTNQQEVETTGQNDETESLSKVLGRR